MTAQLALAIVLGAASLVLAVPALVLLTEVLAALWARTRTAPLADSVGVAATVAVLIPAHDEAEGIGAVLDALRPQLGAADRLLVVADNCSDATASVARAHGAEVIERRDETRRGKSYALDFGVVHLAAAPCDVVVIVDADCLVAPGALLRLAASCRSDGRPAQALYLMHAPSGAGVGTRLAALAWLVKNQVRPLGAAALGWPCQLMGTGMAFPWALIRDLPVASGHIVEDLQLGLDAAERGAPPRFCPDALVTSVFPAGGEGEGSQRMRWEHGHLATLFASAPRLARALSRRDGAALAMLLDLAVPPLAALVLAGVVVLGADALAWSRVGFVPFALAAASLAATGVAVLCAWMSFGRDVVSGRELFAVPLYVLRKIPLYARFIARRQVAWVRTKRDADR